MTATNDRTGDDMRQRNSKAQFSRHPLGSGSVIGIHVYGRYRRALIDSWCFQV